MSEKFIVVQGATCQCNKSVAPQTDTLLVHTQLKDYANDKNGEKKRIATDKEIGLTLQKNSFGNCKMQPTGSSFLPCVAMITKWNNVYDNTIMSNDAKILLEDSKASCAVGGPDCISIVHHGQMTELSYINARNANPVILAQLNPLVDVQSAPSIPNPTNPEMASKEIPEPQNLTPLKVGKPEKSPNHMGFISLEKIKVPTDFDVCNDAVIDNNDFKNFWILEDGGNYYHWLRTRHNKEDIAKPTNLPIIISSNKYFECIATFKTIIPVDNLKIRIRDKDNKYTFKIQPSTKTGKNTEFDILFKSNTIPYDKTAKYFPNFELIFDCSVDEVTWTPLGSVFFCLYVTKAKPLYADFDIRSTETMKVEFKGKPNICETLLWLGSSQANNLEPTATESQLIDSIFKKFSTLKVIRRREGTKLVSPNYSSVGLGYWRNTSSAAGSFTRGLRTLLRDGEARCGEWTTFFIHILLSQGVPVGNDTIGICTQMGFTQTRYFPSYTEVSPNFRPLPASYKFAVKNAIHSDPSNPNVTTGDSAGQGNPTAEPLFIDHFWFYYTAGRQFYDASYGKYASPADSNLEKYCNDNINSVFTIDEVRSLGKIETTNLHEYVRATKNLF
jgi:Domain of unknown function (DUF4280)